MTFNKREVSDFRTGGTGAIICLPYWRIYHPLEFSYICCLKTSGKWRIVTDHRAVNKIIQPLGHLWSGISLPSILPKGWSHSYWFEGCFFTIPLKERYREVFSFTVPSFHNSQSTRRYRCTILPQGFLNSPTLC